LTTADAIRIAELVSALDLRTWDESRVMHWAGVLQRGATAARLPGELLLLTCEELLREVEACEVSPAKLLKRAKSSPPKEWLRTRRQLSGPIDEFPVRYYPDGDDFVRTSASERRALDRSYAGWRTSASAAAMSEAQRKVPLARGGKRALKRVGSVSLDAAIQSLQTTKPLD
jgi:hypothetical protein